MKVHLTAGDALIVVDVQNDFLPGGSLAVPQGDEVIAVLNRYIAAFHARELPIFATRDWHPPDHCSFQQQGGPWPPHCIADTPGAAFPAALEFPPDAHIISKATTLTKDAYSGFEGTRLNELLQVAGIRRVFVGGLATDYCVRATVLDGLKQGFKVTVLMDAIKGVDIKPEDSANAIKEMERTGAGKTTLKNLKL